MNQAAVALLDNVRLRAQLEGLERRVARGGKDSVDHAPGGKDDIANAVAGVLVMVLSTGAAVDMGKAAEAFSDANEEMRTIAGYSLEDFPAEADLPSRKDFGLSEGPIRPGSFDYVDDGRYRR